MQRRRSLLFNRLSTNFTLKNLPTHCNSKRLFTNNQNKYVSNTHNDHIDKFINRLPIYLDDDVKQKFNNELRILLDENSKKTRDEIMMKLGHTTMIVGGIIWTGLFISGF
uniref:Uncharacterized protein n=1 Tax=Moumouvirus sp. 'Monve' TaxID=1128131 RepID=H2EFL6_9VIRU|nr:hypothetical protein mv_L1079 [Moumouvirus Monve]